MGRQPHWAEDPKSREDMLGDAGASAKESDTATE